MILLFLYALLQAQSRTGFSRRALCARLPYSSVLRWSSRQRRGEEPLHKPGPKKRQPLDWKSLLPKVQALPHGRQRTQGTTALQQAYGDQLSRRQFHILVKEERTQRLAAMPRILWHKPGLVWAIDATQYQSRKIIPLQDLASRYRFTPLVSSVEDGRQIAAFLDKNFRQHGAPLFLKRDNGSPFNNQHVDAVLAEHLVLPLNNPPHFPQYNGAMEKSIGDLKRRLSERLAAPAEGQLLVASVEATIHELNHRRRRCLNGKTACEVYHDPALHLRLNRQSREEVLRLLSREYLETIQTMANRNHRALATAWRGIVESWLRRQGLITVGHQPKPNQNVSTIFPKKWSHN
jgi:transposase InsO family protein